MGSFLAKGGRVLGKTVDQRCPDSKIVDPSLLSGAAGSTSVKTDVFMDPGLCFSSPVVRRWKAGVRGCPSRCDTPSGPREGTMRSGQREQSCLRQNGFCPPETSGALVREQSSLRRVGVVGVNNSVYRRLRAKLARAAEAASLATEWWLRIQVSLPFLLRTHACHTVSGCVSKSCLNRALRCSRWPIRVGHAVCITIIHVSHVVAPIRWVTVCNLITHVDHMLCILARMPVHEWIVVSAFDLLRVSGRGFVLDASCARCHTVRGHNNGICVLKWVSIWILHDHSYHKRGSASRSHH